MRKLTALTLVLSFATAPLAAHAQDSRLGGSIQATSQQRVAQIEDARDKALNALFKVEMLQAELDAQLKEKDNRVTLVNYSIVGVVTGLAALNAVPYLVRGMSRAASNQRAVFALITGLTVLGSSANLAFQDSAIELNETQITELSEKLKSAHDELTNLTNVLDSLL